MLGGESTLAEKKSCVFEEAAEQRQVSNGNIHYPLFPRSCLSELYMQYWAQETAKKWRRHLFFESRIQILPLYEHCLNTTVQAQPSVKLKCAFSLFFLYEPNNRLLPYWISFTCVYLLYGNNTSTSSRPKFRDLDVPFVDYPN